MKIFLTHCFRLKYESIILLSPVKKSCLNQERNMYRSSLNDGFVSLNTQLSLHKTSIVMWINCGLLWCFHQLFGRSFWRHPFTAEDPLVSCYIHLMVNLAFWWPEQVISVSKQNILRLERKLSYLRWWLPPHITNSTSYFDYENKATEEWLHFSNYTIQHCFLYIRHRWHCWYNGDNKMEILCKRARLPNFMVKEPNFPVMPRGDV